MKKIFLFVLLFGCSSMIERGENNEIDVYDDSGSGTDDSTDSNNDTQSDTDTETTETDSDTESTLDSDTGDDNTDSDSSTGSECLGVLFDSGCWYLSNNGVNCILTCTAHLAEFDEENTCTGLDEKYCQELGQVMLPGFELNNSGTGGIAPLGCTFKIEKNTYTSYYYSNCSGADDPSPSHRRACACSF